jgi:hypothetical protein
VDISSEVVRTEDVKLAATFDEKRFYAVHPILSGGTYNGSIRGDYSSVAEAEAESAAGTVTYYADGTFTMEVGTFCLAATPNGWGGGSGIAACSTSPAWRWFLEDGAVRNVYYPTITYGATAPRGTGYDVKAGGTKSIKVYGLRELTATARNIDLQAGTADLDGVAPSDSTNVLVEWTNEAGRKQQKYVTVTDGKFSTVLTGLKIGTNPVSLTAFDGGDELDSRTVDVTLDVAAVTAKATFDEDVHTVVQVSGTAQPNSKVTIRHGERDLVTVTTDAAGEWSTPVNAPDMPGTYNLTVGQEIRGEDNGRIELDVDYGAGTTITSPADGFEVEPGETLALRGSAQAGTEVTVHEKGKSEILESGRAGSTGSYLIPIDGLENREYTLVAEGITKGHNRTRAEVTINSGKSSITPISGSVTFPGQLADKAHVVGTAEPGATIVIAKGKDTIATGTADAKGAFDIVIPSQGPSTHTLTLTETKGEATASSTVTADFGDAVTVTDPSSTIEGSSTAIEGTGAEGARIVITEGDERVATGTVTADGTYSLRVQQIQDGEHAYTVTQTAQGNTISEAEITVTRNATVTPVTLTAPASGDTYPAKSTVRFEGTGTPGASVVLDAFCGLADYSTTVDWNGSWRIDRPMNIGTYRFDVVQTAKGQVSRVDGVELVEEGTAVMRPFDVTAPISGSTHKNELVTFTGTGTPGSTITIDPKIEGLAKVTTKVQLNGTWSATKYLGGGGYDFDVYQTSTEGKETGRQNIQVNQPASVTKPFAVISPEDGSDHKSESVTFRGTGTPGSTIRLHVSNFTSSDITTEVRKNGEWEIQKWLGSGTYVLDVTQTTDGTTNGSTTLHLNKPSAPVDRDFAITSPTDGDTFVPDRVQVFRGTGAAGATITLDPGNGLSKVTTQVKSTGDWEVSKYLGNGSYTFTVSQTKGDATTSLPAFTITPQK